VVSLDPDAEHGDGEQVVGELVGDVLPVPASTDPLEVRAGADRASAGSLARYRFTKRAAKSSSSRSLPGMSMAMRFSPCVVSAN
jgi:hypothetical protein